MKRTINPNSPVKSSQAATGDTTHKQQHDERDQQQTQPKQHQQKQQPAQQQQHNQAFYCPTDETDLTIGDQQQVSLLDPRDSADCRQQPLSVKGTTFTFAANMIGGKKTDNGDQAHHQQAKKQSGQKKKNILAAGDGADDDLESNSDSRAPGRSARFWIFIILMGLLIALFLVVITFTITSRDEGHLRPGINHPFQASSYRLFATKTLYTTALNYLSLVPLNAANSPTSTAAPLVSKSPDSQQNSDASAQPPSVSRVDQIIHYDKSSIHRPQFFWHNETLEGVHARLTGSDYVCEARQLHYYGRHAARYPSQAEIKRMFNAFQAIKSRIDLMTSPSTAPQGQTEATNTTTTTTTTPADFVDPLRQFSDWRFFAQENQANLITNSGVLETKYIASRFKSLYPELFNGSRASISIGTTKKIRTAQTAVSFLQELTDLKFAGCPLKDFPIEDADAIRGSKCYKSMILKYAKPSLSFHTSPCASSIDEGVKLNLDRPSLTQWITESVSKSLKLDKQPLDYDEMKAVYDMCKYETAITGFSSIWCSLFTEQQMKFMEYIEDVKTYKKAAYGDDKQANLACLLTNDLVIQLGTYMGAKVPELQSHFHFTHSQVIQKLIAATIDLKGEAAYEDYESKLKSQNVPKMRQWQTSLLSPFSANLALILYSCPAKVNAKSNDPNVNKQDPLSLDVSPRHSRIVVALNEQPLKISVLAPGQKDPVDLVDVPVDLFYGSSRFAQDKFCNFCKDKSATPADEDDEQDEGFEST